ncbi:MAG TPA: nucleotide sugar dehydrogenase [Candidatus Bathyarchaeia archaeon]
MAANSTALADKISSKNATVCVIGLGYVGVPLAVASAQAGFNVLGVDVDPRKVEEINKGVCYVEDKYSEELLPSLVSSGKIRAYTKLSDAVPESDVAIVCVPTPLKKDKDPDLSFLKSVAKSLAGQLTDYKLIVVESTSYPGTTEEVFRPLLERGGKTAGKDFGLVYSPERIDYGNASFSVRSIPKVVGGVDGESTRLGAAFYSAILQAKVVAVSGPSVAEATKMLENVFRYVNIALVNELALLHEKLGVDFIEAIDAAATKPFGFMAHYPGPGVGGHCIPKDPFYLVYKARKAGFPLRMVSTAEVLNNGMPKHTVERLLKTFRKLKKNPRKAKVALWGLAYKGGVKDTRRSPSVDLLKIFQRSGVKVVAYDPFVETIKVGSVQYKSAGSILDSVKGVDAVVMATNHAEFRDVDLTEVKAQMNSDPILFDTRNLRTRRESEDAGFTYLATGRP